MFFDTKVSILDGSFTKTGEALVDLQPFEKAISFEDGITIEVSKRAFFDASAAVDLACYLETATALYKVMELKRWDDFSVALLYECEVAYAKRG